MVARRRIKATRLFGAVCIVAGLVVALGFGIKFAENATEETTTTTTTETTTATTPITTITTMTTTVTTATTTTTIPIAKVIELLPKGSNYRNGVVSTTSIAVKNSNGEIVDYVKEGDTFFYIDGDAYGGMLHIYYYDAGTLYDGWVPVSEGPEDERSNWLTMN